MKVSELTIKGSYKIKNTRFPDSRGYFQEWFNSSIFLDATGITLQPTQANLSSSAAGVIRGVHYSLSPHKQAKWVTCVSGKVLDCIVDLRFGSPTFGLFEFVELSAENSTCVYLEGGLGHAFMALEKSEVVYLLSSSYEPNHELAVNVFDKTINISWPGDSFILSERDQFAPSLNQQFDRGLLPKFN